MGPVNARAWLMYLPIRADRLQPLRLLILLQLHLLTNHLLCARLLSEAVPGWGSWIGPNPHRRQA